MHPLLVELMKGSFTLAAVALGSYIALRVYFRQKEYELTKQRYLENGVDIVASELEGAFGVVSHNYARALQLSRYFRDIGEEFDSKELEKGFLPLDQSKFRQIAHHRISSLTGSNVIWEAFQLAMAEAQSANSVITSEIPETIRLLAKKPSELYDRKAEVDGMVHELRRVHDDTFKHASLINELHTLGLRLEEEPLSLKSIATFRNRAESKAVVARLQAAILRPPTGTGGEEA